MTANRSTWGARPQPSSAPLARPQCPRQGLPLTRLLEHTLFIDAHHVEHWANGGETKPSNLVSLCRFHHHAVHEGGIRIEILDDGALRFVKPNGAAVDSVAPGYTQPLGDWKRLPAGSARREPLGRRTDGLRSRHRGADAAGEAGEGRSSGNACGGVRATPPSSPGREQPLRG